MFSKSDELKKILMVTASAVAMFGACQASMAYADDKKQVNITQQDLGAALLQIAQQRKVSIIYNPDSLKGMTSTEVAGSYSTAEVLQKLLAGSGYTFETDKKGNFYIRKRTANKQSRMDQQVGGSYRVADNSATLVGYTSSGREGVEDTAPNEAEESEEAEEYMEEVTTTGSHIRGVGAVGSKVITFDRDDIDAKGYSTVSQLIQSLPQNFNGGVSESTSQLSLENGSTNNQNDGTGINLRGLGNVSTLVLLNGQRLAPSGLNGSFVDISMIPLSAIERVEVLTDGASAIYGSDAIGGVVNFIMRKDYDGAETRVRYGAATGGGLEEILVGQTFGKTWDRGHGLISYEYNHRDALDARDRSFTKDAPVPNDLLPEQERHSFFLTGGYNLTEDLEVFTTAYYSKRDSERNQFLTLTSPPGFSKSETKQYGGTFGSALDLDGSIGNDWRAEVVGSYSHSEYVFRDRDLDEEESDSRIISRVSEGLSVDGNLDGKIFSMAGGDAKLAIGGHFRHETFGDLDVSVDPSLISVSIDDKSRDVAAIYGEIYLPFVGEDNRVPGVEKLELSISGRYEHYSDFGSSTDPKFGVLWSPIEGLNIRGTYGTSFRAPLLTELDEGGNTAVLLNNISNSMSDTGTSLVILLGGAGNKTLQPETATLWTAGFDLRPVIAQNFSVNVTYFNINYENRIGPLGVSVVSVLNDSRYASFVDFGGPDADLFALIENYNQLNFTSFPGFGPSADFLEAEVVFDSRPQNVAVNKITGIDFFASYNFDANVLGNFNFSIGGTYLFGFLEQLIGADPALDVVDTINNPVNLRLNSSFSWTYEGFATNLNITFVDKYRDDRVEPNVQVSSWVTANLVISYNTEDRYDGWLNDTVFTLSAINLFDQDPPFVTALRTDTNINYDPGVASPAGRVLSFQITKQW